MARASYIYIAINSSDTVVAAFTVKHECATWYQKQSEVVQEDLEFFRVPDGRVQPPVWLLKEQLV